MSAQPTPTIAVDFDGKICEYCFPHQCGAPIERTVALLRRLKADGWRIIIHSSRTNRHWPEAERIPKVQAMLEYLVRHQIPFDEVWGLAVFRMRGERGIVIGPTRVSSEPALPVIPLGELHWWYDPIGAGKPVAHVYDDDRSLGDDDLEDMTVDDLVAHCWLLYNRAEAQHGGEHNLPRWSKVADDLAQVSTVCGELMESTIDAERAGQDLVIPHARLVSLFSLLDTAKRHVRLWQSEINRRIAGEER